MILNDRMKLILSSFSLGLAFAWIAISLALGDKLSGFMSVLFMIGSVSITAIVYKRMGE